MKRRRGERRALPYVCRRCGARLTIVGSSDVGTRILKCPVCKVMDRRLPAERRVLPPELAGLGGGHLRASAVVAVLLTLVALGAAVAYVMAVVR